MKDKALDGTASFLQDTFAKTLSEDYLTKLLESSEAKKVMQTIFTPEYLQQLMASSNLQGATKAQLETLLTKTYLTKLLESTEAAKLLKETLSPEYIKELVDNSNLQGVAKAQLTKLLQDKEFQKETNQYIKRILALLVQEALPPLLQMTAGAASLAMAEQQEDNTSKNLLRSNGGYHLTTGAHQILGLKNSQKSQMVLGATSLIASEYFLPTSYQVPARIFGAMSIASGLSERYKPLASLGNLPGLKSLSAFGNGISGLWRKPKLSLEEAVNQGDLEAVQGWIDLHVDLNKPDKAGWTPLQVAIEKGLTQIAQTLLNTDKVDPNKASKEGWTPLLIAAFLDHPEIVNLLIGNEKVELDKAVDGGFTPLQTALVKKHAQIAIALINSNHVDLERPDSDGFTPLQYAVATGQTEVAQALINTQKIDLNKLDKNGMSLLHTALIKGHTEIAKALIDTHKIDLHHQDKDGWTTLGLASFHGHHTLIQELSEADPGVAEAKAQLEQDNPKAHQAFREAAGKGDLKTVYHFIIAGADLNQAPLHGKTPLYHAAENGHEQVVKALSRAGANLDQASLYGWSPLHHAAIKGHAQVVQALMDAGVDLNQKTLHGETAQTLAQAHGHTEIATTLAHAGAAE